MTIKMFQQLECSVCLEGQDREWVVVCKDCLVRIGRALSVLQDIANDVEVADEITYPRMALEVLAKNNLGVRDDKLLRDEEF
jgi:hypothetical protein